MLELAGQFSGPVSRNRILAAEAELGVSFPESYRDFLERYGAASLPEASLYGLTNENENCPSFWQDILVETKRQRQVGQIGAADRAFVPISDDGMGTYFYLNTRASPHTEIWAIGPYDSFLVSRDLRAFVLTIQQGLPYDYKEAAEIESRRCKS